MSNSRADIFSIEPYRNQVGTINSTNVTFTPLVPTDWLPPPADVQDALDQLAARKTYLLLISSLNPAGTWYPLNYVGPSYGSQSLPYVSGYNGAGFCRVPRNGVIKNFKLAQASPTGTSIDVQLWLAPSGNPGLFGFTGISMTIPSYTYIASNLTDSLNVSEDDLLVFFNADPIIGYTPNSLQITAEFVST